MTLSYPERLSLGHFPTPLEPMPRLSAELGGPELWVKRDDQTGLATGGNKTRKLEFQLAEAIAEGADHLITLGGPQSNHCRQTAAAAAKLGLSCTVVLRGPPPDAWRGNLLLDALLGAEIVFACSREREAVAAELVAARRAAGGRPYMIPLGASTPLGALGFVAAMEELLAQCRERNVTFDRIVLASSSAGTQAGLVLGARLFGYDGRILGISIDAERRDMEDRILAIAREAAQLLRSDVTIDPARVEANADYLGRGYSVVGATERVGIGLPARTEGLLLDPVYTGRAMGSLIDLIAKGQFDEGEKILFWHTGGAAALSAFAGDLTPLDS